MFSKRTYKRKRSFKSKRKSYVKKSCGCKLAAMSAANVTAEAPPLYKVARRLARPGQVYTFQRTTKNCTVIQAGTAAVVTSIASNSSGWSENNFYFTLASLTNYTQFTGLFDQYRVIKCTVDFIPRLNVSQGTVAQTFNSGTILVAKDYDSSNAFGSSNDETLRVYPGHREYSSHEKFSVSVAPCRKIVGIDVTGTQQGTQTLARDWQDSTYSTTSYFGIRTMISPTTNPGDITYDVRQTLYLQFKEVI